MGQVCEDRLTDLSGSLGFRGGWDVDGNCSFAGFLCAGTVKRSRDEGVEVCGGSGCFSEDLIGKN